MTRSLHCSCLAFFFTVVLTATSFAQTPATNSVADTTPVSLTPPAPDTPRINGPKIFGVRPGSIFLYTIPATGKRPMQFYVEHLPDSLKLDRATGQITGTAPTQQGYYSVTLQAQNALGSAELPFHIIVGNQLALTPPMGWNSWNCWGADVSQDKVLAAANAFVTSGLKDHGWTYINIDDGWQGVRGGPFNAIQPNAKFPDMPGLSQQVHGLGLKMGIYSTPWCGSYSGHIGSSCDNADGTYPWIKAGDYSDYFVYPKVNKPESAKDNFFFGQYPFLKQDAQQWTAWGIDYLKYDWHPVKVAEIKAMHDVLAAQPRDVVYSLSNNLDFPLASHYPGLANTWRISNDINDSWKSLLNNGFSNVDKWAPYVGSGHFIDPDMLVVGDVGWGQPHPTHLTPDEQYSHVSLWCLLSAPLMLGCDLTKLDDFTLGLLTNDEVLAVDQDFLAQQAVLRGGSDTQPVYAKPMGDGSWAVGLFNLADKPAPVTVQWTDLGLTGKQTVRDLWRQKDLGVAEGSFQAANVAPHGVVLVRLIPVPPESD